MKNKFCKVFYKFKINEFFFYNNLFIYYFNFRGALFNNHKNSLFNIFKSFFNVSFSFYFLKNIYILNCLKKNYSFSKTFLFSNLFENLSLYSFFFNMELNYFLLFIKHILIITELPFSSFFMVYENFLVYFDKIKNLLFNRKIINYLLFYISFIFYNKFSFYIKKILKVNLSLIGESSSI